jgi:DNA-directed RNA polymerase subunit RPC12/RpoP
MKTNMEYKCPKCGEELNDIFHGKHVLTICPKCNANIDIHIELIAESGEWVEPQLPKIDPSRGEGE